MSLDTEIIVYDESKIPQIRIDNEQELEHLKKLNKCSYLWETVFGISAAVGFGFIGNDLLNSGASSLMDLTNVVAGIYSSICVRNYLKEIGKVRENCLLLKSIENKLTNIDNSPTYLVINEDKLLK